MITTQERVEIITLFFQNNDCTRTAANLFNQQHSDCHVSHTYVGELVRKFRETGSVANKKRVIQNQVRKEAIEVAVLSHITMEPTLKIARCFRCSTYNYSKNITAP